MAAQRRESSPHAKLASLYRHRSWSLKALAGVVGAYVLTVAGYVGIARRAFFGSGPAPLPHGLPPALALAPASLAVRIASEQRRAA